MNYLDAEILKQANTQAVYNLYLYLSDKVFPRQNETLESAVSKLNSVRLSDTDKQKLSIIHKALNNYDIANSTISNYTYSKRGLTACTFTSPLGISVVFKGTGSGEWIDNGEGLSGIPETNTYITYPNGRKTYTTVKNDFATDQQTQAFNWFSKLCHKNSWDENSNITVSGHSKGGNKAQFITIHSGVVKKCFSFNGQGFSPEALTSMESAYKKNYDIRRQKIISVCAHNDYVNVLGNHLMPENQVYYFKSVPTFHPIEDMIDDNGLLNSQCRKGLLSEYVQSISDELMTLTPDTRQYVTRAVMNIFQKYLGDNPLNDDYVSLEETIAGIAIAISFLFRKFKKV